VPDFEFDPDKDAVNRQVHDVSLAQGEKMNLRRSVVFEDDRFDYGEERLVAIGRIDGKVYTMIYTWRGETLRAISLRKAEKHEREIFAASGF
jgi:uncharacterized DUF497 family protein